MAMHPVVRRKERPRIGFGQARSVPSAVLASISAVYRAQADALEIESLAKRRLADEYDAAQERGEVRTRADNDASSTPEEAKISVSELGLTHKDIFEARQIRDAEQADLVIVRRTLDTLIEAGEEPTG